MVVSKLDEVLKALQSARSDAEKVERGNRSAAIRLRKDAALAAKLLKELRAAALEKVKEVKEEKASKD